MQWRVPLPYPTVMSLNPVSGWCVLRPAMNSITQHNSGWVSSVLLAYSWILMMTSIWTAVRPMSWSRYTTMRNPFSLLNSVPAIKTAAIRSIWGLGFVPSRGTGCMVPIPSLIMISPVKTGVSAWAQKPGLIIWNCPPTTILVSRTGTSHGTLSIITNARLTVMTCGRKPIYRRIPSWAVRRCMKNTGVMMSRCLAKITARKIRTPLLREWIIPPSH